MACKNQTCSPVHYLPCSFDTCTAEQVNVSRYFTPTIKISNATQTALQASFRGRPLKGVKIVLPAGYTGIIMSRQNSMEQDKVVQVNERFSEMNYWTLDLPPTSDDKLLQTKQWTNLASKLHTSVDPLFID